MTATYPVTEKAQATPAKQDLPIVDCDIHNSLPSFDVLYPYLSQRWRQYHEMIGLRLHFGSGYPKAMPNAARRDAWTPTGGRPGSDLAFMQEQLLDAWNIQYGILNCLTGVGRGVNLELGAAVASAVNDWLIEAWLDQDERLRASMLINWEDGELAAAEIDRMAGDARFVQTLMCIRTQEPMGRRRYWQIYEAAALHDLPVGIHFGGSHGRPLTGAGWPSYYIEDHCGMAQAFQAQVISLITEGVFERFPTLKIVLIEGGFAWLPPLMWRLDALWEKLRDEVPDVQRPPSEYVRSHFWLTTQPMEEPPERKHFEQLLEQLDMDDRLMFATDYPHWDFDAPGRAFPIVLSPERRSKFMAENACALYRF